jgi:transposase-like protein
MEVSHQQAASAFFWSREGRRPQSPRSRENPVSDLCDELDIGPNLFYRSQQELFEKGHAAFESDRKSKAVEDAKQRRIEQLEAKLQRENEVLSELVQEHTKLRKELAQP